MGNLQLAPEPASDWASKIDPLFYTLLAMSIFFLVVVMIMVTTFAIRYRRGTRVDRRNPLEQHHVLEATWIIGPLFLGLLIFAWGAGLWGQIRQPPKNAIEIFVIGKQWMWHIQHSNGVRENNKLHVPLGIPVKLTMISQDVIHDFFVPAFRTHQDVIPGTYTNEWFTPTRLGQYHFFCSQYCGTNHAEMVGEVYVMDPAEYQKWLSRGGSDVEPPRSLVDRGRELYDQKLCGTCHGATDTLRGPSLAGIYGTTRTLTTGRTAVADDAYLRRAIVDPYADITKGYAATMPQYPELSEEQVLELVAYIKAIGGGGSGEAGLEGTPVNRTSAPMTSRPSGDTNAGLSQPGRNPVNGGGTTKASDGG